MAKSDVGVTLKADGAAQFKKAFADISAQLKTTDADMQRLTSAFDDNENSAKQLESVNLTLQDRLSVLSQRADVLTNRLTELDQEGVDPLSASYQKLLQDLYKNEAEMNKTAKEIKANDEALQNLTETQDDSSETTGGTTKSFGFFNDAISSVTKALGLSTKQTSALSNALNGEGDLSLAVGAAAAAAAIALTAKAVSEVTKFLKEAVKAATDYADEINTLSQQTGFDTDFLQGLQYAEQQIDVSTDSIVGAMRKLKKNLFSDSTDVQEAFAKLNIIPQQLIQNEDDIEDIFKLVLDGLSHMENELEKDDTAMTLFGKSADDLAGVIDDGGEKLYNLIDGYKDLGYILNSDDLTDLQDLDDAFNEMQNEFTNIQNQIAKELAPELTELTKQLLRVAQSVDWEEFGKAAGQVIKDVTPLVVDLAKAVANAANDLAKLINAINDFKSTDAGNVVSNSLKGIASIATPVGMGKTLATGVQGIASTVGGYFNSAAASSQPINVNVQLDSQTIARATYDANRAESNRVGNHAIR